MAFCTRKTADDALTFPIQRSGRKIRTIIQLSGHLQYLIACFFTDAWFPIQGDMYGSQGITRFRCDVFDRNSVFHFIYLH